MVRRQVGRRSGFEADPMPLDAVRLAFRWLLEGPRPLAVDGRLLPGLAERAVPLNEVRDLLLARSCPQPVRDTVWAHLVARARGDDAENQDTEGADGAAAWTVGCAGVALPGLTRIAASLTARFANDPRDVHAAVLAGFLAELAVVDLARPRIMLRLRWAAYRAGHACVREALDAPSPSGHAFGSAAPPAPAGHPDFVLARAVADGVITRDEAELIGSTRLEEVSLAEAAQARQAGYEATKKARRRAELRLADYLRAPNDTDDPGVPLSAGAGYRSSIPDGLRSPSVSASRRRRRVTRRGMSPKGSQRGVQGRGNTSVPPESPEVPRCA